MAHCHPSNKNGYWNSSYADSTMHFGSIPMHLVTLTIPSTMSNFTMSREAADHDLKKMLHCQIQAVRLELFSRKPPHIHVGQVANRQQVHSSLMIIFSHLLQIQLMYSLWMSVTSRVLRASQNLRSNCRHRRRTVDELAATIALFSSTLNNV